MNGKISNLSQVAYIRRYTVTEGKETGLKVCEVCNGTLRFTLNESKALDIMQLWHKGDNIGFVSKNGFSAREIPFLKRFEGGMLYTCGLDSVGGREGFELHGTLHNNPARIISCICNEDEIEIETEIEDTELFGKNLLLCRKIRTAPYSDTLTLEDTLINRGTREEDYCLLYHFNLGYPMLDEKVRIESETEQVIPRNEYAAKNLENRTSFLPAIPNEPERCYFIKHKKPVVTVTNDLLGKSFTLSYSDDTLPCFVQWNSPASLDYALGLEPATTLLDDRFEYKKIRQNEKIRFRFELKVKSI